jgi:hypothetical protein
LIIFVSFIANSYADSGKVIFYLDDQYQPVVKLERIENMTDALKSILAMYALQNGAGCNQRDETGVQCKLTTSLEIGNQCAEQHIRLIRTWFKEEIPKMSGFADDSYRNTQKPGELEGICYNTPNTASIQHVWDIIRVKQQRDHVLIDAHGGWVAREQSGSFRYQTEYLIKSDSITIVSHKEIPTSKSH